MDQSALVHALEAALEHCYSRKGTGFPYCLKCDFCNPEDIKEDVPENIEHDEECPVGLAHGVLKAVYKEQEAS